MALRAGPNEFTGWLSVVGGQDQVESEIDRVEEHDRSVCLRQRWPSAPIAAAMRSDRP